MIKKIFFFFAVTGSVLSCKYSLNNNLEVKNLSCEYTQNPVGIDAPKPRFGWHVHSSEPEKSQSAYQILVASSVEHLNNNKADVVDTKKILSSNQSGIVLKGLLLESAKKYYWKIRVWDENDKVSKFSEPAFFVTGLLEPNDWKASWITSETEFDWNRHYLDLEKRVKEKRKASYTPELIFTKSFTLPKKVKDATLFISGLGFYKLEINQKEITSVGLNPAFTDYNKRVLYNSYDIKEEINQGENTITIGLGNGYYNEEAVVDWGYDKAPWKGRPRLICQAHITFENGTDTLWVSDTSWDVEQSHIVRNSIYGGEVHDYSIDYASHDKSNIRSKAIQAPSPVGKLASQVMPVEKVNRSFQPKSIKRIDKNTQVIDAGINLSGRVKVTFNQELGDTVVIRYGELIDKKGFVNLSNTNRKTLDPIQTDKVIFSGRGELRWYPHYIYHGFQYIEINGYKGELTVDDVEVQFIHADLEKTGRFTSSNDLINRIQDANIQSYLSNYHGFPTDCPQREKNGWTADVHLAARTGLYNFNMNSSFEKWINDIKEAMLDDGRLPGIVPTSGWGYQIYHNITDPMGPGWDAAFILVPWYTYLHNGNTKILEDHFEDMKRNLEYYRRRSPDNIVRFGLDDWSPYKTTTNWEIISTLYYGIMTKTLSKIASVIGNESDKQEYLELFNNIKATYQDSIFNNNNKGYINPRLGFIRYDTHTQAALAGMVYSGFADSLTSVAIVNKLEQEIKANNYNIDCGMFGAEFILKVLSEYNRLETVYKIISSTEKPGWGYWISQGATTLWESWDKNDSRNHVIFGQVSEWFYKHLLGIQPADEYTGLRNIRVNPFFPKDMDWASGYITSAYGKVEVDWKRENDQIHLKVVIPFNSKAEFILVDHMKVLKYNDRLFHEQRTVPDEKSIFLGSGMHDFVLIKQ